LHLAFEDNLSDQTDPSENIFSL